MAALRPRGRDGRRERMRQHMPTNTATLHFISLLSTRTVQLPRQGFNVQHMTERTLNARRVLPATLLTPNRCSVLTSAWYVPDDPPLGSMDAHTDRHSLVLGAAAAVAVAYPRGGETSRSTLMASVCGTLPGQ